MLHSVILGFITCLLQVSLAQNSGSSSAKSSATNSAKSGTQGSTPAIVTSSPSSGNRVPAIEIVGNKFFYSNNGSEFFIKGVAYQAETRDTSAGTTINDPLADYTVCSRDLPYLLWLNTNTVRVYAVNTSLEHSECMKLFESNGIYVIADLSEPGVSVNRDSPSWTLELYERYTSVVDALANYTNVLGFFAGNEVTNNASNTDASPFVKAALRDTKSYIKSKGYRNIPVGYSSNDDGDTRIAIANYFACGSDEEKADFYGINMYEWCGDSTFKTSGYADRTEEFSSLGMPIFFSEYGCNEVTPRKFTEVEALYGDDMTDVWSGGIVYMYFEEANNYGLVSIDSNDKVSTLADYDNLRTQLASVSPSLANTASYKATKTSVSCPQTDEYWKAATGLPPTPDESVCKCVKSALKCVVSSKVDEEDYSELFSYLCTKIDCGDISVNGTSGEYGSFSFCDSETKLSYLLDKYYKQNGSSASACDFSGSASLTSATSVGSCSSVLAAATTGGGKGSGSSSSGGKSSDSAGGSSSRAAAAAVMIPPTYSSISLVSTFVTFIFFGLGMFVL
ncbi:uncharacterized protein Ecym_5665 [Eremothecium cymbalariae DBVPG|uniref:1,3-beta-glucanosyltransferase n=1 Tax=Eremothecium cymbalariae (strain CBS 270.75 / DBVPG 7215 / KCTC 17166 / NRRL Y-17582) TaxID=931890 RepID=I6NEA6_ERECY|nr:hypothetical protein Ecym_5665 [Eremothecium cymbalariae DBVPG\